MGRRIKVLCTVGTSICSAFVIEELEKLNPSLFDERILSSSDDELLLQLKGETYKKIPARVNAAELISYVSSNEIDENERDRYLVSFCEYEGYDKKYIFPTAESQTLIRWLSENALQYKRNDIEESERIESIHLVLLPSEDAKSRLTAAMTCAVLNCLKSILGVQITMDKQGIRHPTKLDVATREVFLESVGALYKAFDQNIEPSYPDEEIVICATGGFKAMCAFAVLYSQVHSIPCLYSFENNARAFEVMNMPLGFAYAELDEEINILKALKQNPAMDISSLPRWVKDSRELAGALVDSYERARRRPYATGEALFERLREQGELGAAWADYLEELLATKWSNLWIGDQIPETVEHSRRHSKRLMEFATNIFRCLDSSSEVMAQLGFDGTHPELLAILIATIYLHDIGHTALSYPLVAGKEGVFPLGMFPSAVREVHQILSSKLMQNDPDRYFKSEKYDPDGSKAALLALCVPLVSEYHRGYTCLQRKKTAKKPSDIICLVGEILFGKEEFEKTLSPMELQCQERFERAISTNSSLASWLNAADFSEKLIKTTALMRIIDGCDVQADRIVSDTYLKAREMRSADEASFVKSQLENLRSFLPPASEEAVKRLLPIEENDDITLKGACNNVYVQIFKDLKALQRLHGSWNQIMAQDLPCVTALSLANRLAFKLEQKFHFNKHRCIGFVLPTWQAEGNTIIVTLYPAVDRVDDDIRKEIQKEYENVKETLYPDLVFTVQAANSLKEN